MVTGATGAEPDTGAAGLAGARLTTGAGELGAPAEVSGVGDAGETGVAAGADEIGGATAGVADWSSAGVSVEAAADWSDDSTAGWSVVPASTGPVSAVVLALPPKAAAGVGPVKGSSDEASEVEAESVGLAAEVSSVWGSSAGLSVAEVSS